MKTAQETFDFICESLIKQGKPSIDPRTGECLYRGGYGIKCAAGHCIPDELYQPDMENVMISCLYTRIGQSLLGEYCPDMVASMQPAHDCVPQRNEIYPKPFEVHKISNEQWLGYFKENARRIALKQGLDPKVLDS